MSAALLPAGRYDVAQDSAWIKQHIRTASDAGQNAELDLMSESGFIRVSFQVHTVTIENLEWMYIGTTTSYQTINIHLLKDGLVVAQMF